jgi:hypothetical protein
VDGGAVGAAQRFKGAQDQIFPRLGQHLNGDILRDALFFNQLADKVEVGLRSGGKATSISLNPHSSSRSQNCSLRALSIGSASAWLPSRRSVESQRGAWVICCPASGGRAGKSADRDGIFQRDLSA